jgi:hypothetical protein
VEGVIDGCVEVTVLAEVAEMPRVMREGRRRNSLWLVAAGFGDMGAEVVRGEDVGEVEARRHENTGMAASA